MPPGTTPLEQLPVQPLQRQAALAALPDDAKNSFSVLHYEDLLDLDIENTCAAPLPCSRLSRAENTGRVDGRGKRHEDWVLAERPEHKIDPVLHYLTDIRVPWSSNLAERGATARQSPSRDLRLLPDPGRHQGLLPYPFLPDHHPASRRPAEAIRP